MSLLGTARIRKSLAVLFAVPLAAATAAIANAEAATGKGPDFCRGWVYAKVVALDQAFYINRLGALQAGGMIFALQRDVRSTNAGNKRLYPGQVVLRPDKRARPIVLRVNQGDCLRIKFTNLLSNLPMQRGVPATNLQPKNFPVKEGNAYQPNEKLVSEAPKNSEPPNNNASNWVQPPTRYAGVHVAGLEAVGGIASDGAWGGANGQFFTPENPNGDPASYPVNSGLVPPGKSITYELYAAELGSYLLTSQAGMVGQRNLGNGGQLFQGLFGAVTVQPAQAEWYRSQVSQADLAAASSKNIADRPPVMDYDALYKPGTHYPSEPNGPDIGGEPILKMYMDIKPINGKPARELVHSDLTAIITGPKHGRFPKSEKGPEFDPVPASPDRRQPYREIVVIYHDDFNAKQSFGAFEDSSAQVFQALQGGRDFFAINYGMAAIGPPIWANRLGVGPMADCATCKYEEFFLSSWPNGDPAMVVDFPANTTDKDGNLKLGKKATKAFYPDDPSNVYHSYIGDHAVYRILHASANITHVHHQHAHQWLHSPNSDDSHYRDSQMISPGASYTLEYVYRGSGNKNQTPGDSIFHCHFYPHFAQGMWALWRVHDTFEEGTRLDKNGIPVNGNDVWNRALPDGEIAQGSPTPAVVPVPTIAMAPLPARVRLVEAKSPAAGNAPVGYMVEVNQEDINKGMNPGFPYFIAGVAGQRISHPPMDFAPDLDDQGIQRKAADGTPLNLDGGLPRHVAVSDDIIYERHNAWDFTKNNNEPVVMQLPEEGTPAEIAAMKAHAQRLHPSIKPDGTPADFILNGQPPARGAPYAEPGITLDGEAVRTVRQYKAADIELDVVFNKKGWHFPQQRMISLWGDVADTLDGTRAPEPLFFRANSGEVIEFWLANFVPNYYKLDDFQVRTPTDVLGQHIHLVKFDVLASDGAANGFNYEDGTYAAEEVRELIEHINDAGGLYQYQDLANPVVPAQTGLSAKVIPYFGDGSAVGQNWLGAQATVQRWYADPLLNNMGKDRTIRTVFTHDHFSPSTNQQAGLYAGLVVEPAGSTWRDPITSKLFGDRLATPPNGGNGAVRDGGPTSWTADIIAADPSNSHREFNLEFQDRQLTYNAGSPQEPVPYPGPDSDYGRHPDPAEVPKDTKPWGWTAPESAINPPSGGSLVTHPILVTNRISTGTYSVNYRNEPLALRMFKPKNNPVPLTGMEKTEAADLSFAFASIKRFDAVQNKQPDRQDPINPAEPGGFKFEDPFPGAGATDPYTPLMRAYKGDKVQIRTLVGAHMAPHAFNLHGLRWYFEPADINSGYRSTQSMGISEHFEMLFDLPPVLGPRKQAGNKQADYMYVTSSSWADLPYGNWGLLRAYGNEQTEPKLQPLPNNPIAKKERPVPVCPAGAYVREYDVTATTAKQALGGGLVYNARGRAITSNGQAIIDPQQPIIDPDALLYVHTSALTNGVLTKIGTTPVSSKQAQAAIEPLILRAAAGECLKITLRNSIKDANNGGSNIQFAPAKIDGQTVNAKIPINTSKYVGLHAQLVSADVTTSNGVIIGLNPKTQVVPFGKSVVYTWYAGIIEPGKSGKPVHRAVEFGSASLSPSDPLMQSPYGMIGALIIEPAGSCWAEDPNAPSSANVYKSKFVYGKCEAKNFLFREHVTIVHDNVKGAAAAGTTFARSVNYGTEPLSYRFADPDWETNKTRLSPRGIMRYVSNTLVAGDPETPVFTSSKGMPVRMRMVHPAGLAVQTWALHGHAWQEEPYVDGSSKIGTNRKSQWMGARDKFGPNNQFDIVLKKAGGAGEVTGDYLYRSFIASENTGGIWGVFRVGEAKSDVVTITALQALKGGKDYLITGVNSVNPSNQKMAKSVKLTFGDKRKVPKVQVDALTGAWQLTFKAAGKPFPIKVVSTQHGHAKAPSVISAAVNIDPSLIPTTGPAPRAAKTEAEGDTVEIPQLQDGRQFQPRGINWSN